MIKKRNSIYFSKRVLFIALLLIILSSIFGFYFKGITGNAVIANYNSTNYSPPYNIEKPGEFIFNISSDSLFAINDIVNLTANVSVKDGYIYQKGYVFNQRTKIWEVFNFDEIPVENSYWIRDFASKDLVINVSNNVHNSSETYIVAYACQKKGKFWECGCQSTEETNCKRWMLHKFDVTNITISPDILCTDNANCSMTNGTCDKIRGVCVSEEVKFFPLGTPQNPFKITSWENLSNIKNNLTASYILMNDLDENSEGYSTYAGPSANYWQGWIPIGDGVIDFNGSFNGNGKTISGFNILGGSNFIGLFGSMTSKASIYNLNLENFILGDGGYVGGLVGYNDGGNITNCSTNGELASSSSSNVGGLVGYNAGLIIDSYSIIYNGLSAYSYAGGLVGDNEGNIVSSHSLISGKIEILASQSGGLVGSNNGNISNSYSIVSGNISAYDSCGGLVGYQLDGEISNSYSIVSGNILVTAHSAGGLVGGMGATCLGYTCIAKISDSYSNISGSILANGDYAGGLVGYSSISLDNISNSYSIVSGNISSLGSAGGLVGYLVGSINNSYSNISGRVSVLNDNSGGLVGYSYGFISNSFSLIKGNISASNKVGGLVGYNWGTIFSSYTALSGNLEASNQYAGGLVGFNEVGTVSNSYAIETIIGSGKILANTYVGGLLGSTYGSISNSYAVISTLQSGGGDSPGGFSGGSDWNIFDSYWDTGKYAYDNSGASGKTTLQMKTQSNYPAAWSFINIWAIDTNGIKNNGYPYLRWQVL